MPSNKEALIRYRAINRALINNRIVSKEKLISECTKAIGVDVAWRTIAADIKAMRDDETLGYFAPIQNIKNEGYRYTEKEYSIDHIPLKNEEITAISFAARLLQNYSHVEIFSTFSGAVEKLGKHVDLQLRNNDHAKIGSFISFEESTADGGTKFIDELLQHIRLQTVIVIDYFSFSSQSQKSHVFHPYFLKEYRNRWYVVGYHQEYQGLRTLALERIKSIQPDYQTPYKASNFDSNSYYNNALGVSITSNHPERVILLVDETQWRYLQSQPMHHSQQLVGNIDSWYELSFMLISNYELVSTILAMGSAVRVLEPPALKEQVALEIKRMYNNVK